MFPNAHPALARAIAERGYSAPTAVQSAVLDPALAGRDLLVSARTGSGKTVGFGLALASSLFDGDADSLGPAGAPLALIVAPTRELAVQVQRELAWLYAPAGGRVISAVGGVDIRRQLQLLQQGVHVLVGTPGRLCDLLSRGALDLSAVRAIVLDEADEMLDMGFREEMETILEAAPVDRRTLLFSATLPPEILGMAGQYQRDAARLAVATEEAHADIEYRAVLVAPADREGALVNLLRYIDPPRALVFATTREGVHNLHARLLERGFAAEALSGDFNQAERTRALQALRDGRARVLVATDVAARGLDIPSLSLVIHADVPTDSSTLLHRSGRTGRAGQKGLAVLLVPFNRRRQADRVLWGAKINARWSAPPSAEQIAAQDQERLVRDLSAEVEVSEEDRAVARILLASQDPETLLAGLVRERRERMPAPEELTQTRTIDEAPRRTHRPEEGVWFRVNIGRFDDARPNWLVPLLCRRGGVQKDAIGPIRIFDRDSRFQIARPAADAFEAAARRPDRREPWVRIQRLQEAPERST